MNLRDVALEVYREPHFTGYGSKAVLRSGDTVAPVAFPDATVGVTELLRR